MYLKFFFHFQVFIYWFLLLRLPIYNPLKTEYVYTYFVPRYILVWILGIGVDIANIKYFRKKRKLLISYYSYYCKIFRKNGNL